MSRTTQIEAVGRRAKPRPGPAARRFGYVVALLVNAAMLYAVNRWPGWEKVPFLSDDTTRVVDFVNASILVSLAANMLYLVRDPRWLKALGDLVTTSVGLVVLARFWQVFPFDFADSSVDWTLVAHAVLAVGIIGSAIGIVAALATFVSTVVSAVSSSRSTSTERL